MFSPFGGARARAGPRLSSRPKTGDDLDDMRAQLDEMQERFDGLVKKDGVPARKTSPAKKE